jgi:hypothetical protein
MEVAMSARKAKSRSSCVQEMQTYIFEIDAWEPEYIWSLNQDKMRDCSYREFLTLHLSTTCIFPAKLADRKALFVLMADRDGINRTAFQRDTDWKPRCIGVLSLRPNDGNFYTRVPHDDYAPLLTALAHGLFRFADLYGPSLRYGTSECSSFCLAQSVNLDDY